MEMIPIISSDRLGFMKKKKKKWRGVGGRIPEGLMSGNMAAFQSATKRHFWIQV